MESNNINESTMDSIDVTIFEDFYSLDITLPFIADPVMKIKESPNIEVVESPNVEIMDSPNVEVIESPNSEVIESPNAEIMDSSNVEVIESPNAEVVDSPNVDIMDSSNVEVIELPNSEVIESPNVEIMDSPNVETIESPNAEIVESSPVKLSNDEFLIPAEQTFSVFSNNLPCQLSKTPSANSQPLIVFSPAVVSNSQCKSILFDSNFSPVNESIEMKENQTPESIRPETPTDMDKTLVLKQISARTNASPLYTPVTLMVSRFRNLALETPFPLSNKNQLKQQQTPIMPKETPPISSAIGHQARLEKFKLVSPLLRSPKFRPVSTRLPFRSNSKVTNSNMKKSPTVAQYKANPPVNQGSRIPVLKLN